MVLGNPERIAPGRRLRIALVSAAIALVGTAVPASASAAFGVAAFDGQVSANASGDAYTQAGGHPFEASTTIEQNSHPDPELFVPTQDGSFKDIEVELPAGLIGNPAAAPTCTAAELSARECPNSSQVGVGWIESLGLPPTFSALYNLEPPRGIAAAFGFNVQGFVTNLFARVRTGGDYGVTIEVPDINQGLPVTMTGATLWGVPAAASHESERCRFIQGSTPDGRPLCIGAPGTVTGPNPAGVAFKAFLRLPSACTPAGVGLETRLRTDSWQEPGLFKDASFISHLPPGFPLPRSEWGAAQGPTGCEQEPFSPNITVEPTTTHAASATGLNVNVHIPQDNLESPTALSQSDLKDTVVTLPEGMVVNPASAYELDPCSSAQIELNGPNPAACPPDSKLGTVEIQTPLLDHAVKGGVYLAKQKENKFGSLLAIYIAVNDPETGVVVKLAGKVAPDPRTGRLTASFSDNPQLPFEDLNVRFFGGANASLITPPRCGTYSTEATFTPWSGTPPVTSRSSFQITSGPGGGPCPNGSFEPKLQAGTTNPVAGAYSPFTLRLTRDDGTQELSGITAQLPKGLVGKLAGIPYCTDASLAGISGAEGTGAAQIASPSCPAASQIGTVTVGAGAGPNPFYVDTGKAYLAGPYKGAPLSMAFVTPAVAGPFDLGNVVVRAALQVDERTAQITAVSDPLPHILHGIPLDLRDVRVKLDRSQFTLNPTSCEPTQIASTITSVSGAQAHPSSRFQVGNCASLPFRPKLKLHLKGSTTRTGHPALKAVVTYPKEGTYANIARAQVGLPHSEFLDQGNLNKVCKQADLHAGTCPKSSIYGWAKAWTPLLDKPLQGPVYLGVGFGYKLPALVADLNGQIRIMLVGRVDTTKRKGIRNTFEVVPDAPVSRFVLKMKGGRKYGLLENSENVCRKKQRASALLIGQNGDRLHMRPRITAGCGKAKRHKGKRKTHARASSQPQAAHGGRGRE